MVRAALLLALLPATALAQTADVIQGSFPERPRTGPVTSVTYDLYKLVKGKGDLKSVDAVKKRLVEDGYLREATFRQAGDPVEELPKCQLRITAPESIHGGIREVVELWNPDSAAAVERRKQIGVWLARPAAPPQPGVIAVQVVGWDPMNRGEKPTTGKKK